MKTFETIRYSRDLKIANLDQLPRGTGSPFLEVLTDHDFIAVQWRNKMPTQLPVGHVLIVF